MVTRRRLLMVSPAAAATAIGLREAGAQPQAPAPPPAAEPIHRGPWIRAPYDTYVRNPLVAHNTFLQMPPEAVAPPAFDQARHLLPEPFWDGHASAIACARKAWELAFANLRRPAPASGFVARFIDPAFNDCVFLWDSCFMTLFGRYGARAFPFVRTLDNFYAKQHPDGFICREIGRALGDDRFPRFDPSSTGPNVTAWAEWEHYRNFGDRDRLARVFPVLRAYHQWLRAYRTWPDGSYWSTGWGCGMDNQPRLPTDTPYADREHYHGRMTWIDATLQQILSARLLAEMGRALGGQANAEVADMRQEAARLGKFVNERLWSAADRFYCDRFDDGASNHVKSIGGYWALLAGIVPPARLGPFVAHLQDPRAFNRPHRVPSLSADHPSYDAGGGYWKGAVWAPTTYMVLRGLTQVGRDALAHEIARNHLDNVVAVFEKTGTLFENYAPESAAPGKPAKANFVGWTGLPPIAVLLEYVFGLRPDAAVRRLLWDVRLTEAHGVRRYPFGPDASIDLSCAARRSPADSPHVEASATGPVELEVRWAGGSRVIALGH
ncbi:MAG: MGH1-like glycoside hydrolase domain-containing protein [Polyangia bacterium]